MFPAVLVASQHLGLENIGLVFNLTLLSFLSGSVRLGRTTPTFKWESSCHTDRLGLVLLPGSVLFSAVTGLTLLLRHWLSGRAWLYLWGFRLQGRVCVLPTPGVFVVWREPQLTCSFADGGSKRNVLGFPGRFSPRFKGWDFKREDSEGILFIDGELLTELK